MTKQDKSSYFENWSDAEKYNFLSRHERLGEILVSNGHLTVDQLEQLLDEQKKTGHNLGQIIITRGILKVDEILQALERQYINDKISLQSIADLQKKKNKD
jgi:hypothetical protein